MKPDVAENGVPARPAHRRKEARFPWVLVSIGVATTCIGALALVSMPKAPERRATPSELRSNLGLARPQATSDSSTEREALALFDPTPLFLPTRHNAGADVAPQGLQTPNFSDYSFKPFHADANVALGFGPVVELPATAAAGENVGSKLNQTQWYGYKSVELAAIPARLGVAEIWAASGGAPQTIILPATADAPEGDWAPMEFMAAVDPAGMIGSLTLITRSGVEAWDAFLARYLMTQIRLGNRLHPGFYRVVVGP